jgi:Ca2+-binding EF-hand superfamily protein
MSNVQLEISEESIQLLAEAIAACMVSNIQTSIPDKTTSKKKNKEDDSDEEESEEITQKEFLALCEEAAEESSKKEVSAVLAEFDYKTPKKVKSKDYAKIAKELGKLIDEEEEEGEEEPITEEDVKAKFAEAKKVDADEAKEALEEYGLKSIKGAGKLSDEDLEELYDDLCDIIDAE